MAVRWKMQVDRHGDRRQYRSPERQACPDLDRFSRDEILSGWPPVRQSPASFRRPTKQRCRDTERQVLVIGMRVGV